MTDPRFILSEETKRLVGYLRSFDKGTEIPYSELSKQIGRTVDARSPKVIHARRILQRDHNAVWICVSPRVGLRRLTDVQIAERLQPWWMRGARNKLKRAGSEVEVVDTKALDVDQLARFGVDCIQRELALNSLSRATRNRMEKVARGTSNDLPSFNILEMGNLADAPTHAEGSSRMNREQRQFWVQTRRAPDAPERATHIAVADRLRLAEKLNGWIFYHVPNGELRSEKTGALLRRMGARAGVPDFVLISPHGEHYYLELKRGLSPLSEAQEAFTAALRMRGIPYFIARNYDAAMDQLKKWGAL